MILDPYGGPGGWAEGLATHGHQEIGVEHDPWACATRAAAGHRTIRADVTRLPLTHLAGRVRGVIMSPPCQAFSNAGDREGQALVANLVADVDAGRFDGRYPDRVRHMLEPGRWVTALGPEWLACEQVPQALPVWQAYARWLRARGYSAWAGVLNSADYGVPQTRRRAFLVASRAYRVAPPAATHCEGGGVTLFGDLAPWVSMAQALGWEGEDMPARTVAGNRAPRWMYPDTDGTRGRMVLANTAQAHHQRPTLPRPVTAPAPTLHFGHAAAGWEFRLHTNRGQNEDGSRQVLPPSAPAPALTAQAVGQWVFDRPATTVAGDPRITARCHHDHGSQGANPKTTDQVRAGDYEGTEPIRLTITEALVLQGFRPDYPVQGTKTAQFQQVGNAVPPPLAAAVLGVVLGTVT